MRKLSQLFLTISLVGLGISNVEAQCSRRGGGSRSATGTRRSLPATSNGMVSPLGNVQTLLTSANGSVHHSRSVLVNFGQEMRDKMRWPNRGSQRSNGMFNNKIVSKQNHADRAELVAQTKSERRTRLREENAERALAAAKRAEYNGQLVAARSHLKRVMRILPDSTMSENAQLLLTRLNEPPATRAISPATQSIQVASIQR